MNKKSDSVLKAFSLIMAVVGFLAMLLSFSSLRMNSLMYGGQDDIMFKIMEKGMPTLFMVLGGLIWLGGMAGTTYIIAKERAIKKAIKEGVVIKAKFERIEKNEQVSVNGKFPNCIICSWTNPKNGNNYKFKSDDIFYEDLPMLVSRMGIMEFKVYVSRDNINIYQVDISKVLDELKKENVRY